MPFIVWTNRMRVDVKLLDNDHKKQVLLVNELHEGLVTGRAKLALERIFEELVRHTRIHIAHEEQIFTETAYPGAAAHEREHDHMIDRHRVLQARFRNCADLDSSLEVIQLLKNCLCNHIQSSDKEYVPHLKEKEVGAILAASEALPGVVHRKQVIGPRFLLGAW